MSFPSASPAARQLTAHPLAFGAISLFLVLATLYCFSIGLRATRAASITGDEPFYLLTTQSLLQDGDLDLRQQYDRQSYRSFFDHPDGLWKQSVPIANGEILSPHEPGVSILVIPGFVVGGLLGVQVQLLLLAALTFALTYILVAGETGRPLLSWLVTLCVGLSATAFVYSTEVYPEVPGALCLVLALLLLRRERPSVGTAVALAVLLSALAWLSMKYVPLGFVVAAVFLLQADRRLQAWFVGLSALSGVAYVGLHLLLFDHLTAYSVNTVYEGASAINVVESHLSFQDRFYRLYGLFIDRRFGIARWAPLFLLILPSLPLLAIRGRIQLAVAALIGLQLCIGTFVAVTMMGYWFPGRTMMTVLPLFALALTVFLTEMPKVWRWLAGTLAVTSLYFTVALTVAVHNEGLRIAVDPFAMTAPGFQLAGRFFPNYQTWSSDTVVLTALWLCLLFIALAMTVRKAGLLDGAVSLAGRLPALRPSALGHSTAEPPP